MRIGELAGRLGLNPRTVRFYESIGVLPEPRRTSSGYRDYGEPDVDRLRFVKLAQSLGLSLDDIGEVLALRERDEPPCPYVRWVIREQAEDIERRIGELERLRAELRRLQQVAERLPDQAADAGCVCHILENEQLGSREGIGRARRYAR